MKARVPASAPLTPPFTSQKIEKREGGYRNRSISELSDARFRDCFADFKGRLCVNCTGIEEEFLGFGCSC